MAFRSKYESAKPLYISYKIIPLEANIKLNQGKCIWKLTHNQHPNCIQDIFHCNSSTAINNNEDNKGLFYHLLELILEEPHLLIK